jgi:hypothetical protein
LNAGKELIEHSRMNAVTVCENQVNRPRSCVNNPARGEPTVEDREKLTLETVRGVAL